MGRIHGQNGWSRETVTERETMDKKKAAQSVGGLLAYPFTKPVAKNGRVGWQSGMTYRQSLIETIAGGVDVSRPQTQKDPLSYGDIAKACIWLADAIIAQLNAEGK